MKKKTIWIVVSMVVMLGLLAGGFGCAQPSAVTTTVTASAKTVTVTAAPAPAPRPEVSWVGVGGEANHQVWSQVIMDTMCERISYRTDGKFNVSITLEKELGITRADAPTAVMSGAVPIGHLVAVSSHFPWWGLMNLPFLIGPVNGPLADHNNVSVALRPIIDREFSAKGIARGADWCMTPVNVISKAPIDDASDLGIIVRCWNETTANIITALKGEPVIMPTGETYVALQRGVIDAVLTGVPAMNSFSMHEVAGYLYLYNLAPGSQFLTYNIEAFNALPEEYQKILLEELAMAEPEFQKAYPEVEGEALDIIAANGVELVEIPADQMARVVTQCAPLWAEWEAISDINKEALDIAKMTLGIK